VCSRRAADGLASIIFRSIGVSRQPKGIAIDSNFLLNDVQRQLLNGAAKQQASYLLFGGLILKSNPNSYPIHSPRNKHSDPAMLPPPTTQWSSVLHSTRSALAWREEHNGTLRVQLRLVNRRGLFLAVFFGLLFLTAVSVGVLAHLHVKGQFYALVLSPVLVFLLLAITYRGESRDIPHFRDRFIYSCFDLLNQSSNLPRAALAPIEEFIFERETRTVNSTTANTSAACAARS
jgi:hypothetical protein